MLLPIRTPVRVRIEPPEEHVLKRRWKPLSEWLLPEATLSLEKQFFQALCLLGGVLTLAVVIPANLLQDLNPWVNRLLVPFGFGLLALAWAARRGHYLRRTALIIIIAGLDLIWFPNGGSQGSIGLYFFSAALFLVLFFEGYFRVVALFLLLANIFALHFAEALWPNLLHTFSKTDRLIDLLTGYALSLLICSLMLWVVLSGFNREKQRLAESEGLYRELLNRQGEGFAMLDAQERFLVVNPMAEEIFGVAPGQLVGRSLLDLVPLDQQELLHRETGLRADGSHSTYELRIRRDDGAQRTLLVTGTPRPDHASGLPQTIGIFRDITEWREQEDQLRESEEKFRAYIEQSIDVIFTLDADGNFTFVSPAWERHFGYPVKEVIGHAFAPFVHPDDIQPCFAFLTEVLATGHGGASPPYRVKHADGSWRWFRANGIRLSTAVGAPQFMGVAHDITERRQAEEALKASEARYRALFDLASEGIFTLSTEGVILEVNEAMARMHGYTVEEMKRLPMMEVDTAENSELAPDRMRRLLAGEAFTFEVEHLHKDGHVFPLEVSASLVQTEGRPVILAFHREITERKTAEEAKRLLEQEKQQAQKMDSLGSLAGGVAHDFNNMLSGIMGYADLLLSGEENPKRQKALRAIIAAATRSAELTQKLLAFARRGRNLVEALDLQAMVKECLDLLRPSMNPDLHVVVAMDGCPTVDGDPSQIHQVVVNLCINAMEAMPDGGVLTIAASIQEISESSHPGEPLPSGRYVELSVSDTGVGMSDAVKPRIFEPFFTTKTTAGVAGTGLGLSTAYGIIHAHGGTISVDSTRGKGTTFRVLLPAGSLPPKRKEAPAASATGQGLVLLVEDEPLLREMGKSILESLGYEVISAADGVEAVEAYRLDHHRFCAVLLDLKMPRMAGREAFRELQKINLGVPVLVCTGYGENEEVQELLTLGAAGMLAKPYQISTLAAKLRQVTQDRRPT
ncbi:MAG TPA: PAS domain S-box protein [Geothrix sp.]|nr:PAS domain S-box protein [Geothrix sp.]